MHSVAQWVVHPDKRQDGLKMEVGGSGAISLTQVALHKKIVDRDGHKPEK